VIEYTENGWTWANYSDTPKTAKVILNESVVFISDIEKGVNNNNNIELSIESEINKKHEIRVKLFNGNIFNIKIDQNKKINLFKELFDNINRLKKNLVSEWLQNKYIGEKLYEQNLFATLSFFNNTTIYYRNEEIEEKSILIYVKFIFRDVKEFISKTQKIKPNASPIQNDAELSCQMSTNFSILLPNNCKIESKGPNYLLNYHYNVAIKDTSIPVSPVNSLLSSKLNIVNAANYKKLFSIIEDFYDDDIGDIFPKYEHTIYQNKVTKNYEWYRGRVQKIILDNSNILDPKLIWLFDSDINGDINGVEMGKNITNFSEKWIELVNNLGCQIEEKTISDIPKINLESFPQTIFKLKEENIIVKKIKQRRIYVPLVKWNAEELELDFSFNIQDWNTGTEETISKSFSCNKSEKWLKNKIIKFWRSGEKKEILKEINDFYITNYILPCKDWMESNGILINLKLGVFRGPKMPYNWPYIYIINHDNNPVDYEVFANIKEESRIIQTNVEDYYVIGDMDEVPRSLDNDYENILSERFEDECKWIVNGFRLVTTSNKNVKLQPYHIVSDKEFEKLKKFPLIDIDKWEQGDCKEWHDIFISNLSIRNKGGIWEDGGIGYIKQTLKRYGYIIEITCHYPRKVLEIRLIEKTTMAGDLIKSLGKNKDDDLENGNKKSKHIRLNEEINVEKKIDYPNRKDRLQDKIRAVKETKDPINEEIIARRYPQKDKNKEWSNKRSTNFKRRKR